MRVRLRLSHRGKNTDSVCVREHGAAEICKVRSFTNINLRHCYGDKIKKGDMGETNVYNILVKKRKWKRPLGMHRSEGRLSLILKWIVQTQNTKVFKLSPDNAWQRTTASTLNLFAPLNVRKIASRLSKSTGKITVLITLLVTQE